jgi:hypothetical protein
MKFKKDQISSLFQLIIAGIIHLSSIDASIGSFGEPGLGLVPFVAVFPAGILSLSSLVFSILKNTGAREKTVFQLQEMNWRNLITMLGALFAFSFLLKLVGYNLTVFRFMIFLAKTIEPRRWVIAVLFALSTTLVYYLLFVYWLRFVLDSLLKKSVGSLRIRGSSWR